MVESGHRCDGCRNAGSCMGWGYDCGGDSTCCCAVRVIHRDPDCEGNPQATLGPRGFLRRLRVERGRHQRKVDRDR